jgi:type I restriction enzyme, S subunit
VTDLPPGWARTTLGDCFDITPGWRQEPAGTEVLSIVPMAAVEAGTGRLDAAQVSRWADVRSRNLTRFQEGDVLFAKITPCMENGKIAIARNLQGGIAVGSTEFHVLRSTGAMQPEFALHFLLQASVRRDAERHMSGAVGQRRVPRLWLSQLPVPVPPLAEQRRIVDALEAHLSRLDACTTTLALAKRRCDVLVQALIDTVIERTGTEPVQLSAVLREPLRNGHSAKVDVHGRGVPTLSLTAVTRNEFDERHIKRTVAPPSQVRDLWLRRGDVLVQRANTPALVGTSAVYDGADDWAIFPDLLIRIRVNETCALPHFVAAVLKTTKVRRYYRRSARGMAGSMPKIDQEIISRTPIPLPSLDMQANILRRLDAVADTVRRTAEELERVNARGVALRRSILDAAFSGRLVPQDPNDEPALLLLKRIQAERAADAPRTRRTRKARATP